MYRKLSACFLLVTVIVSGCKREVPMESPAPVVQAPVIQPLVNAGAWVVTASSQEKEFAPGLAVDGSRSTRWSSEFKDGEWWMVDFGKPEWLGNVVISWEDAFASSFRILVSTNGTDWVEVYSQNSGLGGTDIIDFTPQWARQVKIECVKRAREWGSSFFEVEFNKPAAPATEASSSSGSGDYAPKFAIDGKMDTRWSSNFGDSEWWQVRFAEPRTIAGLKISWETAFAEKYEVQVSMDGQTWQRVYNVTDGDGRTDLLFFKPVQAQYLRIQCLQRGTGWGNSIYEINIYDQAEAAVVTASSTADGSDALAALDGDPGTAWHSAADGEQSLAVKLPQKMSLGGLELTWGADFATSYTIDVSTDGQQWKTVYTEQNGNGEGDYIFFPATDAQFVRVSCLKSGAGAGYAIRQMEFKGGEEQATPIRAYQAKARDAKPGRFPMWLGRQQEFWTVVGLPEDEEETLLGETGIIEPRKNDFSIQPFIVDGTNLVTWADVRCEQKLEKDYLPMPSVTWHAGSWKLEIAAVACGEVGRSCTAVRYRFINPGATEFKGKLALAVRPVQLNPVWQHGGFSPINEAECDASATPPNIKINGQRRMEFPTPPTAMGAAPLSAGEVVDFVARGEMPATAKATEPEGKVGIGAMYDLQVPPGGTKDIVVVYLLHTESVMPPELAMEAVSGFQQIWAAQAAAWEKTLDEITIQIPEKRLIDVMKSNFGYVLVNRDPPWFKPGSRNYNHAWTRDGALTGVAMLRMGEPEMTKAYIRAYSPFVADTGWAPHMILEDGKPVMFNSDTNSGEGQEYDSQGEYVFIVRQYFDFTGDDALLREVYPKVVKSLRFAQELRRRRMTDDYRNNPAKQDYYGILPLSNSHEGYYPAKHSYWDDFWVLKGFKDGIHLAQALGETNDVAWMTAEEQDFRKCLYESILRVIRRANLSIIPGCVELADTDPTSTSVAIMACDETDKLPEPYGTNTFNVYWDNFSPRLKPGGEQTFTPYECRNADVFFRIGERDRGLTVLRYFTGESTRPHGWNHFAEVVHAKVRAPSYIGDMPHTWISSDYINAVRSMFAYEQDRSLVVAAGIDPAWLETGVVVSNLPTQFGTLNYTFKKDADAVVFDASGAAAPSGGFVIPLPDALKGRTVEVNGSPLAVEEGRVTFAKLPAVIRIK